MNISNAVWTEAEKRGLDWICTGGGCDFIHRKIKSKHHSCELHLSGPTGASPRTLKEACEVGVCFHEFGFVSVGIPFKNAIDAMDFMQKAKGVYFLPDMYERGKADAEEQKQAKKRDVVPPTLAKALDALK